MSTSPIPDPARESDSSEAQSRRVEASQPEEQNPPRTVGGASSDLEGVAGTKNRAHFGTDPDREVDPRGDTRSGQNPPHERSQRKEESGSVPPSEKNQAAFKSGTLHTDGLAGQVEAAMDDETPATGSAPGAQNTGTEPRVPDSLAKPAGQVVADAYKRTDGDAE